MKRARLFTPISFFPRSRGKMKKGDRKGSSDFDGSTDRIFKEAREEHKRENVSFSSLRDLRDLRSARISLADLIF